MQKFSIKHNALFTYILIGERKVLAHIDTGGYRSAISSKYFRGKIVNKRGRKTTGAFVDSNKGSKNVTGVGTRFVLFGKVFKDLKVDVLPFLKITGKSQTHGFTIAADMLLSETLFINFKSQKIGFLKRSEIPLHENGHILKMVCEKNIPFFSIENGKKRMGSVFDTGAGISCMNKSFLKIAIGVEKGSKSVMVVDSHGKKMTLPIMKTKSLRIGGSKLRSHTFVPIDFGHIQKRFKQRLDFVFGLNMMKHFDWIVDRKKKRILIF